MIVVGLGNPGDRYQGTRHNVGFAVVELLAERWGRPVFREKFSGRLAQVEAPRGGGAAEKVYLLEPLTFMNLSGQSVAPAARFFKQAPSDVLVVHDELDLPFGRLQLKEGGGSGGHNGLKSVTEHLGTPNYRRLRVGIGRPPANFRYEVADFVLERWSPSEAEALPEVLVRAASAVEMLLESGLSSAMNQVNRKDA